MSHPRDELLLDAMAAALEYIAQGMGDSVADALHATTGDEHVRARALGFFLQAEPVASTWERMREALRLAQRDVDMLDFFRDEGVAA